MLKIKNCYAVRLVEIDYELAARPRKPVPFTHLARKELAAALAERCAISNRLASRQQFLLIDVRLTWANIVKCPTGNRDEQRLCLAREAPRPAHH